MRYLGYLMVLMDRKEELVEAPEGSTIGDLVGLIDRGQGASRIPDGGGISSLISNGLLIVMVNGVLVGAKRGDVELRDGDEIWLEPPIAGG